MKKIVNSIEIELTQEEIVQRQIDEQKAKQYRQERLAKEQAKADAKASALAKLAALGLTEEEVKSIL